MKVFVSVISYEGDWNYSKNVLTQNNFLLSVNWLFIGNPCEFELMKFYSEIQ